MPDENLPNLDKSHLEQFLATASDNPQALLLGAYLEEKEKWENKLDTLKVYRETLLQKAVQLEKIMVEKRDILYKLQADLENESGIWISILGFFCIKTKAQRKFYKIFREGHELTLEMKNLGDEFTNVSNEYEKIYSNPPDTRQYELAMIGNTLFKPR
jgi:hypothetical protein